MSSQSTNGLCIEDLLSSIRSCTLCNGLPLGPQPIIQAAHSSRILVAGQAPGSRTHEKGVPFDDASGERLRHWMGIGRTDFYNPNNLAIVPMGFCYPGTGRSGDLPPRPECAKAAIQLSDSHLSAFDEYQEIIKRNFLNVAPLYLTSPTNVAPSFVSAAVRVRDVGNRNVTKAMRS